MSHISKGLFDPRRSNVVWPEPNDDPNIPYAWGLNGYMLGNSNSPAPAVSPQAPANVPSAPSNLPALFSLFLLGASATWVALRSQKGS